MKKFFAFLFVLSFLFIVQSCKKSNNGSSNNNNNNTPQPTAVGTPTGIKTSKLILRSGGSITSTDGKVELDFPSGALPDDDTISIQPITNNCPGGTGLAYRLEPEGITFNQAVTLKFHYDDSTLKSTLSEFMLIASQDSSGIWIVLDSAGNDSVQHVLSGKIHHFSDWTQVEEVAITPTSATLRVSDQLTLSIINTFVAEQDITVNDNKKKEYALLRGNSSTWAVNGVTNGNSTYGTISVNPEVSPLYDFVQYTAPSAVPPPASNPVLVSAEFNQQLVIYDESGSIASANKVILYAHIYIVDGGYHVELSFQAEDMELGSYWNWKDKGSFDVVLAGTKGTVTNINNSDAVIGLDSNTSTCTTTLAGSSVAPINIVDSSIVAVNTLGQNIIISFNALDQKNYIKDPVYNYSCPGGDTGQLGGALGPPFPLYLQFNIADSTQTQISGQYKVVVTPIK